VARSLKVQEWVTMVRAAGAQSHRDNLLGVSVTLAACLLGVSRARVHQLLNLKKLIAVDVFDERHVRIGHLVTLASIERRRRTVRPRRTQWRSVDPGTKADRSGSIARNLSEMYDQAGRDKL